MPTLWLSVAKLSQDGLKRMFFSLASGRLVAGDYSVLLHLLHESLTQIPVDDLDSLRIYAHVFLVVINNPNPYIVTRSDTLRLATKPVLLYRGCHTPSFYRFILNHFELFGCVSKNGDSRRWAIFGS